MKDEGMSEDEVMSVILTQQYLDVLSEMSSSQNTKVLIVPSDANTGATIQNQMLRAFEMAKLDAEQTSNTKRVYSSELSSKLSQENIK